MDICLITDNPDINRHPVIGVVLQQLNATHTVRLLDVHPQTGDDATAHEDPHPLADLYLLKAHSPPALKVAYDLERRGALVVNSWASSVACQDRVRMARRMKEARLPFPHTWRCPPFANRRGQPGWLSTLRFPLMMKSRYSHRGDLVVKVQNHEEFHALAEQWSHEPCIHQEYAPGDGWDIKVWVVDRHLFAARRRTPLEAHAPEEDRPIPGEQLPSEWRSIALEIGRVFHLRLYGVDLLMTQHGPLVVDVNAFPGFRGVAGADAALIALIGRLAEERQVTTA